MVGTFCAIFPVFGPARVVLDGEDVQPRSLRSLLPLAFLATLGAVSCVVYLAIVNARSVAAAVEGSEHTQEVLLSMERARRMALQLSNEVRRSLLADAALSPEYDLNKRKLREELAELRKLVADDRAQSALLHQMIERAGLFLQAQERLLGARTSPAELQRRLRDAELERIAIREQMIQFGEQEQRLRAGRDRIRKESLDDIVTLASAGAALSLVVFAILFLSLDREIRRRARVAEALERSEQYLSATLESIGDAVVATDQDGRVRSMNRAAIQLTGVEADYVGRPRREIVRVDEAGAELNASHECKPDAWGLARAAVVIAKDGRRSDVECVATEIRDADGRACGTVSVLRDVTRERQLNALFRRLLHAAPDAIVICDEAGKIRHANEAASGLFGYTLDELLSMRIEALMPERFRHRHLHQRARFYETGASRAMDDPRRVFFGCTKQGREFRAAISLSPMRTALSTWAITVIRDVTEQHERTEALRLANQRVEATNRELEAFSYSVAHDLRAPLRQIVGFASALSEDYGERLDEQGSQYLALIRDGGKRMGQLIEDLLALSRVTRADLRLQPLNLTDIVTDIFERLRRSEPAREVALRCAPSIPAVADPRLLTLALENLLGNAWKFTRKRASAIIEVGSLECNGELRHFVRDNGAGFDMRRVTKLFVPFQRLHKAPDFEGTGIGLATVQRVIHRHGGRIQAEGALDEGATFWFTLGSNP